MSRTEQRSRPPRREPEQVWVPRTKLGTLVATEKITTMKEIYENGYRIQEAGIIKKLLPGIKTEVIDVGIVQKQEHGQVHVVDRRHDGGEAEPERGAPAAGHAGDGPQRGQPLFWSSTSR